MRALGLAAVVALLLSACSTSWSEIAPAANARTETTVVPPSTLPAPPTTAFRLPQLPRFTLGATDIQAVNAPAELPESTQTQVQSVLDRYLNNALVIPMRTGTPVPDLGNVFAGPVLDRLSGPDRAALLDDVIPKAEDVLVGEATADLIALVGPDGVAVLAVSIRIVMTGTVEGGPVNIERTGEFQMAPEGGDLRVSGYDVSVTRTGPEGVMTTTTTP